MADRGREIELKLEIDPADIAALKAHPLLAVSTAITHRQVSTYFDTAEQQLRRSGFALRVREIDGRFIQTVKGAGLFDRPEWEKPIAGPIPTDTPVAAPADLLPIFTATVDRTVWHLREGASEIELALDQGEIRAGDRHDQIAEIELELKDGSPADIFAAAQKLAASIPLRLGMLTKSERGYLLIDDVLGKPVKAIASAVAPEMTAEAAFRAIASACIRQFRLNEPLFVRDRDSLALHQCRVALRRLRSAFSMFARVTAGDQRESIIDGLRWISTDLGDARDLDVFIAKRIPKGAVWDALTERNEASDRAILSLNSHRFRILMIELAEWLELGEWRQHGEQPIADFAEKALDRFWRKVKKNGRHLAHLDDEPRHAVRIAAKKLRYGSEFFAPLFGHAKRRHAFIAALADLQDHLGDLNDIVTARILTARFPGIAFTDEPDRAALLAAAEKAHDRLTEIAPFWR